MNSENYSPIASILSKRDVFIRTWDSPGSLIQIRLILEETINELCVLLEIRYKHLNMNEKMKKVMKNTKSVLDKEMQIDINQYLNSLKNDWHLISEFSHYKEGFEDASSEKKEIIANSVFRTSLKLLYLILENEKNTLIEDIFLLTTSTLPTINNDETIKKFNLIIENLKIEADKNNIHISSLSQKINTMEVDKKTTNDELVLYKKELEIAEKTLKNDITSINRNWVNKTNKNINKNAFMTIIYGESKYRTFDDLESYFNNTKGPMPSQAIDRWNKKQEIIDQTNKQIDWENAKVSSENEFDKPSNLGALISYDSDVRYNDEHHVHSFFVKLNNKNFNTIKINNFNINQNFIKQEIEWHLFACWARGILNVNPVYINEDGTDYHIAEAVDLSNWNSRFNNYEIVINNFLNERFENGI